MAQAEKAITAEQLAERLHEFGRCELIRGEVAPVQPSFGEHGEIAMNLAGPLDYYVRQHGLGRVYAAETGFTIERNPDTVRAPDLAYIRKDRLPPPPRRFMEVAPDLVAEGVSSNDRYSEVSEKVEQWIAFGCQLVWVADPRTQTVTAYYPDGSARVHHRGETLDPGAVLPGFALPVDEVFA
jgi:Uma2 family endonuclease